MRVPDGWRVEKLGGISTAVTSGSRDWAQFYAESGSKFLRMTNLSRDGIYLKLDDLKYVDVKGDSADGKRTALISGDILISITAELGKIGWVPEEFGEAFINQHTALVRINQKLAHSKFIAYLLSSGKMNAVINQLNDAGAKAGLNLPTIKSLPILLPSISEQQKIAQILSTWDKAIDKLEALIAAKQKRKKALMQQLLTGKMRFSKFGQEWKQIRLKKIINEERSRNKDRVITRVLSVTNHSGFVLPKDQFSRQVASDDLSNYKIVRKGEFGYNPSRINVGSFARLDDYDHGVLSPMYVIFSINDKVLDSDFFINWMKSHEAKQKITSSTQGSVRDSVGFDALGSFLITLPPIAEQQKIALVLTTADKEITIHQKQFAALKQQKKALMQQLLTGKKRVQTELEV